MVVNPDTAYYTAVGGFGADRPAGHCPTVPLIRDIRRAVAIGIYCIVRSETTEIKITWNDFERTIVCPSKHTITLRLRTPQTNN